MGDWNLISVGKSGNRCRTHTPVLSDIRGERIRLFILQLLSVID